MLGYTQTYTYKYVLTTHISSKLEVVISQFIFLILLTRITILNARNKHVFVNLLV